MRASILLIAALLSSCSGRTDQQRAADNQMALNNPEVIGTLPDGRALYHSTIYLKGAEHTPQEIYYAGTDLTINGGGKAAPVRAISGGYPSIIIDGQRYGLDEVRAAVSTLEHLRGTP